MKKVLIEIPDDYLTKLNSIAVTSIYAEHIIKCGKDLSEMTIGDMIEAMLPNAQVDPNPYVPSVDVYMGGILMMRVDRNLWNAAYKEVEK